MFYEVYCALLNHDHMLFQTLFLNFHAVYDIRLKFILLYLLELIKKSISYTCFRCRKQQTSIRTNKVF